MIFTYDIITPCVCVCMCLCVVIMGKSGQTRSTIWFPLKTLYTHTHSNKREMRPSVDGVFFSKTETEREREMEGGREERLQAHDESDEQWEERDEVG